MMDQVLRHAAGVASAIAVAGMSMCPFSSQAGEVVSVDASLDWATHYVWRGQLLTDHPVLQPSLTLSSHGFSANVWSNVDCTDINEGDGDRFHLQELDYSLSYGFSPVEGLDLEGGFIWYTFPSLASTGEVYASATASGLLLSPALSVYYDVDEVDGWYAAATVGHGVALTEKLELGVSGSLGWGDSEYHQAYVGPTGDSSLSDALLMVTLSYSLTDHVSLSVYGAYSEILDSDVERDADMAYGDSDILFAGLSVGVSF